VSGQSWSSRNLIFLWHPSVWSKLVQQKSDFPMAPECLVIVGPAEM
jgi:hypothetical protein